MELKLFNSLNSVQGVEREVAEFSAEQCVKVFHQEYNKKGGSDNAEIERLFSIMTYRFVDSKGL